MAGDRAGDKGVRVEVALHVRLGVAVGGLGGVEPFGLDGARGRGDGRTSCRSAAQRLEGLDGQEDALGFAVGADQDRVGIRAGLRQVGQDPRQSRARR